MHPATLTSELHLDSGTYYAEFVYVPRERDTGTGDYYECTTLRAGAEEIEWADLAAREAGVTGSSIDERDLIDQFVQHAFDQLELADRSDLLESDVDAFERSLVKQLHDFANTREARALGWL